MVKFAHRFNFWIKYVLSVLEMVLSEVKFLLPLLLGNVNGFQLDLQNERLLQTKNSICILDSLSNICSTLKISSDHTFAITFRLIDRTRNK